MRFDVRSSRMHTYADKEIVGRTLYIEAFGLALKITLARK